MIDKNDYFQHKAKDYEKESRRVNNVKNIADTILRNIVYEQDFSLLDFGSGTGLLTAQIAPHVGKITAIDMSKSMNEVLREKIDDFACELEVVELDMSKDTIDQKFNGIISSMTIHHVEDILDLFKKFHEMLEVGGTIAIADLDTEDGSFHSEDTGVFHFGFDRDEIVQIAKNTGFKDIKIQTASVAQKPYGDYPIFLLTAIR